MDLTWPSRDSEPNSTLKFIIVSYKATINDCNIIAHMHHLPGGHHLCGVHFVDLFRFFPFLGIPPWTCLSPIWAVTIGSRYRGFLLWFCMDQILITVRLSNPKNSNTFKQTYMVAGTITQVGPAGLLLMIYFGRSPGRSRSCMFSSPLELNHLSWIHYQLGGKWSLPWPFGLDPWSNQLIGGSLSSPSKWTKSGLDNNRPNGPVPFL